MHVRQRRSSPVACGWAVPTNTLARRRGACMKPLDPYVATLGPFAEEAVSRGDTRPPHMASQQRRCGACGALGHNARTCPSAVDTTAEASLLFRSSSMPSLSMKRTGSLDNLASAVGALCDDDGDGEAVEDEAEEGQGGDGQPQDRERKKGASPADGAVATVRPRSWLRSSARAVPS